MPESALDELAFGELVRLGSRMGKTPVSEAPHRAIDPRSGRTLTAPEGQQAGIHNGPSVVTWLRRYDTRTEYRLPPDQAQITIGSADCDIVIQSPFVSQLHCRLDRRGAQLEVTDEGSKNGTAFDGELAPSFYLKPGQTFTVGELPYQFLALNDEMRALYPALTDILGDEAVPGTRPPGTGMGGDDAEHVIRAERPSPSSLIIAAVRGAHLLITGEPGCDQDDLARMIHAMSRFRLRPIIELGAIPEERARQSDLIKREATRSTLVLTLASSRAIDPIFVSMLFSPSFQVRVIVLARTVDMARKALDRQHVQAMHHIALRPLALRSEAIPRLLDRMLEARDSPLRVSALTEDNQGALRAHGWPENLSSLRHAADRLASIAHHDSIPKAAAALGIKRNTLYHWYTEIVGLSYPLLRAAPSPRRGREKPAAENQ
jgi:FHA domain-containing protein